MDITDFEVDQVWVPEHGIKVNNRRIIIRIVTLNYNNKQVQHIYYDVPIFCPACETLIRREGQESDDLEDFIAWIKAEDAVCTSDPEYTLNQLRSARTQINGLQLEITRFKTTIEELENKVCYLENLMVEKDFNEALQDKDDSLRYGD